MEEEKTQLNLSQQEINNNSVAAHASPFNSQNRVRHIYLEQQNAYGRFVPFLLLKDKLHSQIDTSGTSALVHMCSHNSPYLPIYLNSLKHGDPILNRATNLGHTPMDVAGMYCKRQYVDLLRKKGAKDEGRVDTWAIQGANIDNWSGNVDVQKKNLIHWAAYNDLPRVLEAYQKAGANMHQTDQKGNTPIDMAVIHKSYQSVQVLAKMGYRPKQQLLDKAQSPYLTKLFSDLNRPNYIIQTERSLKLTFVPLLLLSHYFLSTPNLYLIYLTLLLFAFIVAYHPRKDSIERPTAFFSQLVNQRIQYGYNHLAYMALMMLLVANCGQCVGGVQVQSVFMGVYFWVNVALTAVFGTNLIILLYGVFTNTTPSQMFQAHKHPYLWKKIEYLTHKNIVMRTYKNPYSKQSYSQNLKQYLNYRRPQ